MHPTCIMPLVFFMAPERSKNVELRLMQCSQDPTRTAGCCRIVSCTAIDTGKDFNDGLAGSEGTFNMCTFWMVEALTRAGKTDKAKLEQARLMFEKMLGYANHLGLYGEETGSCGEALGNFPQAFTHLGLISAAFNLDRTLGQGNW